MDSRDQPDIDWDAWAAAAAATTATATATAAAAAPRDDELYIFHLLLGFKATEWRR